MKDNGNRHVTQYELLELVKGHSDAHHELDIKLTQMCNRIQKIEEKMDAAVSLAKWAIPVLLTIAILIEHVIIAILTSGGQL